jgi:ABC-type polysaccharide/polyol phosphate export permease
MTNMVDTTVAVKKDFFDSLKKYRLWISLAHHDIKRRYHRTVLGPIWLIISMIVWVGAMGFVFTKIFKMDGRAYFPFASASMILWNMFLLNLNESSNLFVVKKDVLSSIKTPFLLLIFSLNYRNWLIYLHGLATFFLLMPFFDLTYNWKIVFYIPGTFLIAWNMVWMSLLLSILGTRYRDIPQIVQNILQATFFITPIFWKPELLSGHSWIYLFNPFHHFLEVMRAPLLGDVPSLLTYIVVISLAVVGSACTLILFRRTYARVYYWL